MSENSIKIGNIEYIKDNFGLLVYDLSYTNVDKQLIAVFPIEAVVLFDALIEKQREAAAFSRPATIGSTDTHFEHDPGAPGLTKLEYVTVQILTGRRVIDRIDIERAIEAAKLILELTKTNQ